VSGSSLRCRELVELLGEYLEGTLAPGAEEELEEHLRGCRGCSALLDQLGDTVGLLGSVPLAATPPDELPDDVRAALTAAFDDLRGPRDRERSRDPRRDGP
jgi:predicted anti-sigma-YlaC factor YlaD